MRFGGHETFWIREGWLYKGLKLLVEQPDLLVDEHAADWLGVGRNMAKSIRHWLVATGLADRVTTGKQASFAPTEFGQLIYDRDLYFSEVGTWWALHVNLVHNPAHAYSFSWFFNHFNLNRFEKAACVENLHRALQLSESRLPSPKTLDRDIACLLGSYSRSIPGVKGDPEESRECPLTELALFSHFRMSGYYQVHQGMKDIPPHLFGYAMARAFPELSDDGKMIDITLSRAARQPNGPGKVFALTSESLFETILQVEKDMPDTEIQIAGLAGDRVIRIRKKNPLEWLNEYYADMERRDQHAA